MRPKNREQCKVGAIFLLAARRCGSTDDEDAGGFDSFRRRPKSFCITGPPPQPPPGPHSHMGPMGRKVISCKSVVATFICEKCLQRLQSEINVCRCTDDDADVLLFSGG